MTIASYEDSAKKKNNNQEKSRNSILKLKKIGAKHHGMAYNHRSENSLRTWIYFCSALFLLVSQSFFFLNYVFSWAVGRYENLGGGARSNPRHFDFIPAKKLEKGPYTPGSDGSDEYFRILLVVF